MTGSLKRAVWSNQATKDMMLSKRTLSGLCVLVLMAACAPERGSEAWCEDMDEKDKGDWSMNDAGEYAKSCILRQREDG